MKHNEKSFNSLCSPKMTVNGDDIKTKRNSAELVESPKIMRKKEYEELNMIQVKLCDLEEETILIEQIK